MIERFTAERGFPPSMRDMGKALGVASMNGIGDHLRALTRKGYITRERLLSRSLRILPAPGAAAPPTHATLILVENEAQAVVARREHPSASVEVLDAATGRWTFTPHERTTLITMVAPSGQRTSVTITR
jgi:SOS-response transcriptional repressor LexA